MSHWSEALAQQLAEPQGWAGALVGTLMRLANAQPNRHAIAALDVGRRDRILEIGFGPGEALAELARRAPAGQIDGIDHSGAMLAQARRRNARAIAEGRMRLVSGSFNELPYADETIDAVLMVNVAYFFSSADTEMREVRRVLKTGGRAVVYVTDRASMDRWSFARTGHHRLFSRSDLARALNNGGFAPEQVEVQPLDLAFGVKGLLGIATRASPGRTP